jgi:cytoplasmic iron level regulating protein YaaA (DUF328/UPF0246 family)
VQILLPPSETKRDGGSGQRLALGELAFPKLAPQRRAAIRVLRELARDLPASARALKLGPTRHHEVLHNRRITTSPTMPAIDRFTGVLYDGLAASSLTESQRAFAHEHVLIHSALLGPIAALDQVPVYRLSADSSVPGLRLRAHWADAVARQLAGIEGLVLDLRSEAYAALGPVPTRHESVYLRVLSEGEDGRRRALNHFNKKAKGEFTAAIVRSGADVADVAELIEWASAAGWRLERLPDAPGELALIV